MTIKKIVLFCNSLLIISFSISHAQNQVTVAPIIGLYLYNSENSLPVMGDENYLVNYGFEVSYRNNTLFGYSIQFDYSYLYSSIDNVLEFEFYDPAPFPNPNRFFYSDVSLSLNTFEISINGGMGKFFSFGFGPSFAIVNKSIIVENADVDHQDFVDRLASFNIGLNGIIEMRIPFNKSADYWYFYSGLKFRYLHGFFYDEGLRNLDDYNQNFVTANLAIGIGYNF
jgi:hypothetical protein